MIIALWPTIFVNIPSGHAGVYFSLFFGGTDTKSVRGEGFQLKFPWDTIIDYDIRLQQVPYEFSVITADGLQLRIMVSVRCKPLRNRLALLQKDIGPELCRKDCYPPNPVGASHGGGRLFRRKDLLDEPRYLGRDDGQDHRETHRQIYLD